MQLSIVICTYNRGPLLKRVLDGLVSQFKDFPAEDARDVEIILVDNNSTDDTKVLVEEYTQKFSLPIRYIFEKEQGLSYARNTGVKHSHGDLVAFLDDDIYLGDDWLKEAFKLSELHSGVKAFGGRVIPDWETEFPSWVKLEPPFEVIQSVFPSHNYGEQEKEYPFSFGKRKIFNPIGANMLFSKELFNKYGDFRADLGVTGTQVRLCEDTEFINHIRSKGEIMNYVPQLVVHHPVPEKRMSKETIKNWYKALGESVYTYVNLPREASANGKPKFVGVPESLKSLMPGFMESVKIAGAPLYLYKKLFLIYILWIISHLSFYSSMIFWLDLQISKTLGEFQAARKISIGD